jgi:hypothetical protein
MMIAAEQETVKSVSKGFDVLMSRYNRTDKFKKCLKKIQKAIVQTHFASQEAKARRASKASSIAPNGVDNN